VGAEYSARRLVAILILRSGLWRDSYDSEHIRDIGLGGSLSILTGFNPVLWTFASARTTLLSFKTVVVHEEVLRYTAELAISV
jgi:hypothetical protein